MIKIGSHISFKAPNYLPGASNESIQNGANAMMIYLGPPQSSKRVSHEKFKKQEYENLEVKIARENIVVHAPYIINPASLSKSQFATEFLIEEIKRMNYLGLRYLVLHPGAHTTFPKEEAIKTLVKTVKEILSKTHNVEILLETMAGKGTELGSSFEELAYIIKQIDNKRVGVCLDTCHIWDAGYDLNNLPSVIDQLKENNLLDKIKVLHINDSKNELGSRKDRHANIGKGFIGLEPLKEIVHCKEFSHLIKILETPFFEGKPIYKQEIKMLSSK